MSSISSKTKREKHCFSSKRKGFNWFGHIQSECANTMKKKTNLFKTTWNDEDSDGSGEEDDHVSNYIAFQVTSKKNGSATVMINVATSQTTKSDIDAATTNDLESNPDRSDGEKPSTENIQEAYQIIYENWIKVCKANKALKEKIMELNKENEMMKIATVNYEFLASDRERKIQQISIELINTQKSLKMFNSGSIKLDHILSMGQTNK